MPRLKPGGGLEGEAKSGRGNEVGGGFILARIFLFCREVVQMRSGELFYDSRTANGLRQREGAPPAAKALTENIRHPIGVKKTSGGVCVKTSRPCAS